jgi:hypothetical protein
LAAGGSAQVQPADAKNNPTTQKTLAGVFMRSFPLPSDAEPDAATEFEIITKAHRGDHIPVLFSSAFENRNFNFFSACIDCAN